MIHDKPADMCSCTMPQWYKACTLDAPATCHTGSGVSENGPLGQDQSLTKPSCPRSLTISVSTTKHNQLSTPGPNTAYTIDKLVLKWHKFILNESQPKRQALYKNRWTQAPLYMMQQDTAANMPQTSNTPNQL